MNQYKHYLVTLSKEAYELASNEFETQRTYCQRSNILPSISLYTLVIVTVLDGEQLKYVLEEFGYSYEVYTEVIKHV